MNEWQDDLLNKQV